MYSGLLDTTHLNWKLGARMRDSVNGKMEMEVGKEKFEREKVGSGMFLGRCQQGRCQKRTENFGHRWGLSGKYWSLD